MVNLWNRNISITPTAGKAAPNNSGRCVIQAPTSKPPLLPPAIANFAGRDQPKIVEQVSCLFWVGKIHPCPISNHFKPLLTFRLTASARRLQAKLLLDRA